MAIIRSVIRGVGAYLPKRVMTNDDLARLVDTTDEWIKERTGIEQRHIADDGELTSDLGIAASRQALVRSGIDSDRHRSRHLRDRHAGPHFSCDGREDPGGPRHDQGRCVRRAGRMLGLHLWPQHRRQFHQDRAVQARAGGRRRNVLAHPRLEGSRHVRIVRRRRRRRRARSPVAARQPRGSRHSGDAHPLGWAFRGPALRGRRTRLHQDHRTICA